MLLRALFTFLVFFTSIDNSFAQLDPQQQQAKNKGIILYNQLKAESAIPFLLISSEAGDHESQYFLGEALRKKNHYMNAEARKWYEASANQGDLYAMIQLGRSDKDMCKIIKDCTPPQKEPIEWLNQAKKIAKEKAESGSAEAMYIMYEITIEDSWLEKAAIAGDAQAQYWMAVGYKQGDGFFLPWKRSQEIEKWFRLSAENGYPRSMMEYAALLFKSGDLDGFRHWNERAASASYADAVYGYGSYLAHEPNTYDFPYDPVKGYSLVLSLSILDGGGDMIENVDYKLPLIAAKLTELQILQAKKLSEEWTASHPPLSFYPDRLSR